MNAKVKTHLSNIFVSQVSNERAIYSAKNYHWWTSVVMAVLGAFLPVIPIMVTQGKTTGSDFIKSAYYGYDQYLAKTSIDLDSTGLYRYYTENNQLLAADKTDASKKWENTWIDPINEENIPDETPIAVYDEYYLNNENVGSYRRAFEVYYTDRVFNSKNTDYTVSKLLKKLAEQTYILNTATPVKYTGQEEYKDSAKYSPSFLLLHKNGMYGYVFKTGTTSIANYTSSGFDWTKFKTEDLFQYVTTVEGIANKDAKDANYVAGAVKNWKVVFNKGFENQKIRNFWSMSGLFYGIHLVLVAFMGFMMWLLTRGKNNPNRGLKVYTCFWIAGWCCVAPAILAMILGFIFSIAQQIAFIALLGLRIMWLAMRQLNPQNAQ